MMYPMMIHHLLIDVAQRTTYSSFSSLLKTARTVSIFLGLRNMRI
jgi:hypothetical protein